MESRLRKLLSTKRSKPQPGTVDSELDLHSIPYTTAPSQGRLPVFLTHAIGRPATAKSKDDKSSSVHSFSYNTIVPGTPPLVGERPQRGNGPVKLQTSRRLSSGEILVTQQDYDRTLQDIRDGEFILGGKEKRISRPQPLSSPNLHQPKLISTAPNSPYAHSTFLPQRRLSRPTTHDASIPWLSQHGTYSPTQAQFQDLEDSIAGVNGFSNLRSGQYLSSHMGSTTSLLDPHEERNPTIQALWKAEYSRLVALYGQTGVDRNISELNQSHMDIPSPRITRQTSSRNGSTCPSSPALQSNPHSSFDSDGRVLHTGSDMSASHLDLDRSDSSTNIRYSLLSSSGASSSFTARTSITEDSITKREDIRRIVDDMRTTYLNAIEAHTPPLQPLPDLPSHKPRSTKKTRSLASSTSVESGLHSINRHSGSRTKSWQSTASSQQPITPRTSTSSPSTKSLNKRRSSGNSRRTSNQPVAGISSLPAIEASPAKSTSNARKKGGDVGLKRADSTTLGSMEKMLTIVADGHSIVSPHLNMPATPTSPRIFVSPATGVGNNSVAPPYSPAITTSPPRDYSIQSTPEKPLKTKNLGQSGSTPSWHIEAEQLFADADVDLSLNIDSFEALCNDMFSTPATGKREVNTFETWGNLGRRNDSDNPIITELAPSSPTRKPQNIIPSPTGLGLSVLSAAT